MIHVEHSDEKTLEWDAQKLNEQLHGLVVLVADGSCSQDVDAALEDLVHIPDVFGVVLDREVHEGNF